MKTAMHPFPTHPLRPWRAAALALLALAATGAAAQGWPTKPIKLLASSSPGAGPDAYARALADMLAPELGQPVVVENVPAGGGMLAAQQLLRAPADGHTLLVGTAGMLTITPTANPRARYTPADFSPICQGVEVPLVLASHPSVGVKGFDALAAWIQQQKPAPTYSSYSAGSPAHFLGYQLAEALKTEMVHVPYRSTPQQLTDMLGGVAPLGFVLESNALPHIQAGKLLAHASTSATRTEALPEVPTMAQLGHPQITATVWFGLVAPKAVAPEITARLTALHQKIAASPGFKTRMAASSLTPTPGLCGGDYTQKMTRETAQWARVIKATGFVADN